MDSSATQIRSLMTSGDSARLNEFLSQIPVDDRVLLLSRLPLAEQTEILSRIDPELAADVLNTLPDPQTIELIGELSADQAAPILHNLPSEEQADIVALLESEDAEEILEKIDDLESAQIRKLMQFPPRSAGGLMSAEYLVFDEQASVQQAVDEMRANALRYSDFEVQYAYVADSQGRLVGVLRLRDLLLALGTTPLNSIMIPSPISVCVNDELLALHQLFIDRHFVGVPVVDQEQRLVGVLHKSAVEEAWGEQNADQYLKSQGLVREELRTMPLWTRCRRRLAWLSINIGLNIGAATIISIYQGTLEKVIALAVFLPIISDMSGCSGNQAVAVSMRELSLGVIRPREVGYVLQKELSLGLINGLVLGLVVGMLSFLWKGNIWLGAVVGSALMANTVVAVVFGGTLPLIMRILKLDPALASGPILTTITDMCGFLIVLALASSMIDWLA